MMLPLDPTFGDLRALLQEPPSAPAWELVCALLDAWPADDPELERAALPYAIQHTSRWPAHLRPATRPAIHALHSGQRRPSLQLAHSLDTFSLGPDGWRTLLDTRPQSLRALQLNPRNLVSHEALAAWEPLSRLEHLAVSHSTSSRWLRADKLPALLSFDDTRLRGDPHQLAALYEELPALDALATRAPLNQPLWQLKQPSARAHIQSLTLHIDTGADLLASEQLISWLRAERDTFARLRALTLHSLYATPGQLSRVVPAAIEQLSLLQLHVPARDWTPLLSRHRDTLRELVLWTTLEGDAASRIAAAELPALRKLTLTSPRLSGPQLSELLSAPWLAQLDALHITGQQLDTTLMHKLHMPALRELVLADCAISPEGLATLMSGDKLPALERLELTDLPLAMTDAVTLANSPHSATLRELALRSCRVSPDQLRALSQRAWPQLTSLDLRATPLQADHVSVLHASPLLTTLRLLQLDAADSPQARAIARDPALAPLIRFAFSRA